MDVDVSTLPPDVANLNVKDLEELGNTPELVRALAEFLPSQQKLTQDAIAQAKANEAEVAAIRATLAEIDRLSAEIKESATKQTGLEQEWKEAEKEMYAKSQAYTLIGIEKNMKQELEAKQEQARALEQQISQGGDTVGLVKEYVEVQKRVFYLEAFLKEIAM